MSQKAAIISNILFYSVVAVLFAISIGLFLNNIYIPKQYSFSFTQADLAHYLPFVAQPEGEGEKYIATRLGFLFLLSLWPCLILFARRSLTDLPLYQTAINLIVRFLLLTAIVAALINIQKTSESTYVSSIYLIDVSDSMSDETLEMARTKVNEAIKEREPNNDLQVVSFASSPRLIKLSGTELQKIDRHSPDTLTDAENQQSDLQAALRYTYTLFPESYVRRVVIISDANQTKGDFLAEAAQAKRMGIRLDAMSFEAPDRKEVMIRGVGIPDREQIIVGKPFTMELDIYATHPTTANVEFYKDDELDEKNSKSLELSPGANVVQMESTVHKPGPLYLSWQLKDIAEDNFLENNRFEDRVNVDGKPRILYIDGNAKSNIYLQRALQGYGASQGQNFEVEQRPAAGLPQNAKDIEQFSAVILSDTPAVANTGRINVSSQQMNILDNYVRRFGGGFIAIGGEQAFGLGGYEGTTIEKILPIEFKAERKKEQPSIAMALLIDKSGSMSGPKLELAKEAAKATVDALNNSDRIMVIGFDDIPYTVSPLTRAINRRQVASKIARMRPEGGTNIEPALEMAYLELALVSARLKHVIILTDGKSPYGRIDQLVRQMARESITISTIAVGQADTVLLKRIASLGKGRAHYTNDPYSIPQIFVQETEQLTNNAIVEEPFIPTIKKSGGMLSGIVPTYLTGYVSTKAKSGAETLLSAPSGAPILATWPWGSGRTTAFTSDAKNRWASAWINNNTLFSKFWAQVVRATMKSEKETLYDISYKIDLSKAHIYVDAIDENDLFINMLDVSAKVQTPTQEQLDLNFQQIAPGLYHSSFEMPQFGSYAVEAKLTKENTEIGLARLNISHPFAAEYIDLSPNTELLRAAVLTTGGKINPSLDEILDPDGAIVETYTPVWPYFVWAALFLMILDLILRRIRMGSAKRISLLDAR